MNYATLSLREFHGINFDRLDYYDGCDSYVLLKC